VGVRIDCCMDDETNKRLQYCNTTVARYITTSHLFNYYSFQRYVMHRTHVLCTSIDCSILNIFVFTIGLFVRNQQDKNLQDYYTL